MQRRQFLSISTVLGLGAITVPCGCALETRSKAEATQRFGAIAEPLLKEWTDALLALQVNDSSDSKMHGVIWCPACEKIHGRCMDAVYPFLYFADKTGEQKYMDAAIRVMDWAENVTLADGSWTVIPDPKSWRGTSVFGAISLADALLHHGHVLPNEVEEKWMVRLARVGGYLYKNFTMRISHVNYGFTAVWALNLLGRVLGDTRFTARSHELAAEVKDWFTGPNTLLFGEDKPADEASMKGLLPIDLGYNVEESLGAIALYAQHEKDEQLLTLITKSLHGHLKFMLPDGAWDNSWGTRQYKWSYWGSRTCDGSQVAYGFMADRDASFGTAAFRNMELLKRCTYEGLLAGGLHYESRGVKACIHHTFTHAKAMATILDHLDELPSLTNVEALPREVASGIEHISEVDVWLAAKGPWRATISSYDQVFKRPDSQAATGGALAVLYHKKLGLICTASLAKYVLVEKNNQQPLEGEDYALTPRVEVKIEGEWYTNLYDLSAEVDASEAPNALQFSNRVRLQNDRHENPKRGEYLFEIIYEMFDDKIVIKAKPINKLASVSDAYLVVPIVSKTEEKVVQLSPKQVAITKPEGLLTLASEVPFAFPMGSLRRRTFNHVPGVEALPIEVVVGRGVEVSLSAT